MCHSPLGCVVSADVNNSEHVCKSEFHRWAQIHAGSEDFLGLVAKVLIDILVVAMRPRIASHTGVCCHSITTM